MGRPSSKPKKFHCCGRSWVARSGLHYHKVKYHGYKPTKKGGRHKADYKPLIKKSNDLIDAVDLYLTGEALEDLFEEYYTNNEVIEFDPDDFFI